MDSEQLQLLIAGYVLGNLDLDEAAEFERLLSRHPTVSAEVERMQKALELSYAPPEVSPPAHLREAILADQTPQAASLHSSAAPNAARRRSFDWNRALNIAAAVVIAVLGSNNYRLWKSLQAVQTETQRLATLVYALQATEGSIASAQVKVDPNRLEAVLTVRNLPPLPPGKVYALWTVVEQNAPVTKDQKSAILTDVFNVDAEGKSSQSTAVPEVFRSDNLVSGIAITVEDAAAPQKHQGKPVMMAAAN